MGILGLPTAGIGGGSRGLLVSDPALVRVRPGRWQVVAVRHGPCHLQSGRAGVPGSWCVPAVPLMGAGGEPVDGGAFSLSLFLSLTFR